MLTNEVADVVVGVARMDEFEGHAFSVGPMGIRVGFAFQQERALNLVLAMHIKGMLSETKEIAIVGGGLAGAMVKLALHGLGYPQATLFEPTSGPMTMQRSADHRVIHPCYNNWPMVDRFDPTTNFPFMNWHTDNCGQVANALVDQWAGYRPVLVPARTASVHEALLVKGGVGRPAFVRLRESDGTELGTFDLVIFATGFGDEVDLQASDSGSYWDGDGIANFRDKAGPGRGYVSGIGDGGLIDFVRLCCNERRIKCSLPIAVISMLRHQNYSELARLGDDPKFVLSFWERRIRAIETTAAEMLPETPVISTPRLWAGSPLENDIADFLHEGYAKIVRSLPPEVCDFIDETLVDVPRMGIIGHLSHPYSCTTAPINKLLVAYILAKNPGSYVRGHLEIAGGDVSLVRHATPGDREALKEEDLIVVRHGANPPVYAFSGSFKVRNAGLSRAPANLTDVDRGGTRFCDNLRRVANDDPGSTGFLALRKKEAIAFSKQYLGVKPYVREPTETSPPRFEVNSKHPDFRGPEAGRRLGGFPRSIFGIPLVAAPPKKGRSATRRLAS